MAQTREDDWLGSVFWADEQIVGHLLAKLVHKDVGESPLRHAYQHRGVPGPRFDDFFLLLDTCPSPALRAMVQRLLLLVCALTIKVVHDWALQSAQLKGPEWVDRFHSTMMATDRFFHLVTCTEHGYKEPIAVHYHRIVMSFLHVDHIVPPSPHPQTRRLPFTHDQEQKQLQKLNAGPDLALDSDSGSDSEMSN